MDVVFGIMGSMVCDRIGVRKTAIIGLSIGLPPLVHFGFGLEKSDGKTGDWGWLRALRPQ